MKINGKKILLHNIISSSEWRYVIVLHPLYLARLCKMENKKCHDFNIINNLFSSIPELKKTVEFHLAQLSNLLAQANFPLTQVKKNLIAINNLFISFPLSISLA